MMNQSDLFSRAELSSLGLSARMLDHNLKKLNEAGLFSLSGRTLANGKPEKLYKFSDLPKKWQKKISEAADNIDGQSTKAEVIAGSEKSLVSMPDRSKKNFKKTNKPFEIATPNNQKTNDPTAKAAVSGAASSAPAASLGTSKKIKYGGNMKENTMIAAVSDIENRTGSVKEAVLAACRKYGVSKATIYNWINAIKGKPAEENGQIQAFGEVMDFKVQTTTTSPEAIEYMVGTYLQNQRVTKQLIVETTIEKAAEMGWRTGSKATMMRLLLNVTKQCGAAITLKRGGTTAFTKWVAPLMRRELTSYLPLDLIVGDQHIFDYFVFDDKGNVCRPECYVFVDMGSRMIVGFHATLGHYNSNDVACALYEACRFGMPKAIYTDMGKPELSKHVNQVRHNLTVLSEFYDYNALKNFKIEGLDELVEAEGATKFWQIETVDHKVAIGRRPNSKPIEGYFAILEKKLYDITGGRGYCKRVADPDENLKIIAEAEKHKKSMKLLRFDEFFQCVFEVFEWWNGHEVSTDHIVPQEWFFEGLRNNPRPQLDEQHFDFMLLPEKVCTVRHSKIKLNGTEYYHPELSKYSGNYSRENRVWVKYHPDDRERVHLFTYDKKHEYIGMPEIMDKINPNDEEQVAARMEIQKRLQKQWREFIDRYEQKGESLQRETKAKFALDEMAERAERTENTKRIVKEARKKISQKEADELFLAGS